MKWSRTKLKRMVTLVAFLFAVGAAQAADDVDIRFIIGNYETIAVAKAAKAVFQQHPELKERLSIAITSESTLSDAVVADFDKTDVLFLDIHSLNTSAKLEKERKHGIIKAVIAGGGRVFAVGESLTPKSQYEALGVQYESTIRDYWQHSGRDNLLNMLRYTLGTVCDVDMKWNPRVAKLDFGYYHHGREGSTPFASYPEFLEWYKQSGRYRPDVEWVGLGFYASNVYQEQNQVIDALIDQIEESGLNVLPHFGYPAHVVCERLLMDEDGNSRVSALLGLNFKFAGPDTPQALQSLNIPVFNLIKLYQRSQEEWAESDTGLSVFEGVFQITVPGMAGLIAPTVVGSEEKTFDTDFGAWIVKNEPISERIETTVARIKRYVTLRGKTNAEKKLAVFYYNYPPGKANVGASYLNVAESLLEILRSLKNAGYVTGDLPENSDALLALIQSGGRNVSTHAPGELESMVSQGQALLVPVADYEAWFEQLPERYRSNALKDWGEPDGEHPMFYRSDGANHLVVPALRFGNIAVLPQPARGFGQDLHKLYHAEDLAPPHNYTGIYRWVRNEFAADAIVHLGTHGTLEWLSGKAAGLAGHDPPDALIADLPNIYPYIVDNIGEALVAKRRSAATIITHMIPPLTKGGLYHEYAELNELLASHHDALSRSAELARAYMEEVRLKVVELGIHRDLDMPELVEKHAFNHDRAHDLSDYLFEMKKKNIPYGLHTYSTAPEPKLRQSTVDLILEVEKELKGDARKKKAEDLDGRIVQSATDERDHLLDALAGNYVLPGTGNDPVRNPDSLPTGRNVYGVDPSKVPKKAAWKIGKQLTDQMIADHLAKHGDYPQKVSFVIWGTETLRHEGVQESQIFYLLGTRPVWNARGKVVDVELIPSAELKRPRIDIVISSAAEGMFGQLTKLIDKAVQMVNNLDEENNRVRQHTAAVLEALLARGYSREDAAKRAGVRVFDEPPGIHNLNVAQIIGNSGSWDSESVITDDYFRKMGHGYGNGFWGEPMEDVFRLTLSGTDKVVHSASSNLYGALDNDDFFMYAGGLVQAIRELDGASPELVVTNTTNVAEPRMSTINEFIGTEFRSRFTNPKWIKGMQKEGYAGARMFSRHLEYLWGWQVTVPETVGKEKWEQAFDVYVKDKYDLEMAEFFDKNSPHAYQDMVARMLETVRKDYWQPSPEVKAELIRELIKSVNANGLSCAEFVCGNPLLIEETIESAMSAQVPKPDVDAFKEAFERAVKKPLNDSVAAMTEFTRKTNEVKKKRKEALQNVGETPDVEGYVLSTNSPSKKTGGSATPLTQSLLLLGAFGLAVLAWRRMRRKA